MGLTSHLLSLMVHLSQRHTHTSKIDTFHWIGMAILFLSFSLSLSSLSLFFLRIRFPPFLFGCLLNGKEVTETTCQCLCLPLLLQAPFSFSQQSASHLRPLFTQTRGLVVFDGAIESESREDGALIKPNGKVGRHI